MRFSKLILFAAIVTFFSGCASLFHTKGDLEIVAPADVQVQNTNGGPIPSYRDAGGIIVQPDPARTDSLRIVYGDHATTVALAKNPSALELLNFLSYGIGFPIDDLSHSWFTYAPVYVTLDSAQGRITGISASSTDWLGDRPGARDLHALVLLGIGFAFQIDQNGGIPLPIGLQRIDYPLVTFQAALGADYKKELELFYLIRDEPTYAISNDGISTSEIAAGDLCLRYFVHHNLFLQGSFGKAFVPSNTNETYDPQTESYISSSAPSFSEIGAAIGWAGDISYISLQYFQGLSSFSNGYFSDIHYHTVYLNFGLNFRL